MISSNFPPAAASASRPGRLPRTAQPAIIARDDPRNMQMKDRGPGSFGVETRTYLLLVCAAVIPLSVMRLLITLDVPLGKPGTFVYLYAQLPSYRLIAALPAFPLALIAGGAVLLVGGANKGRRLAGLLLGLATMAAISVWCLRAPPEHSFQHLFNMSSPSHDGAFFNESELVTSVPLYLSQFHLRARTPEERMRGTRVISNPPGATLLALAARAAVDGSQRLRAFASRPFHQAFADLPPKTIDHAAKATVYAWMLTVLWMLGGWMSYPLARLYLPPPAAMTAAFCCFVSPMTLTLSPGKDPMQLLTATAALYLWLRAYRDSRPMLAVLAGIAAVVVSMVGLIHVWIGLIALGATAWHARRAADRFRPFLLRCLLPGVGGVLLALLALYWALDWNVIATVLAVARSQSEVTRGPEAMPLLWQALGVPLFLLFAGPAFWVLAFQSSDANDDTARLGRYLFVGTATIMIATVGFTNLETPRLWIPFMPLLIIGAATGQTRFRTGRSSAARFLALLAALQLAGSAIHWSFMDMRESETRIIEQRFFD